MRRCAIFDRDGVLNVDSGYVHKEEDWEWVPGAIESLRRLASDHIAVAVVSNQSGIGRGWYSLENVEALHMWVNSELKPHGAHIDRFYVCPHLPDSGCDCRKPLPGMVRKALSELQVEPENAFLVGDNLSDIEAADRAGVRSHLFAGPNLFEFLHNCGEF